MFLLALAPRMVFLHQLRASPTFQQPEGGDSMFYHRVASGASVPGAYFHSPLYQHFLTTIYRVAGPRLSLVRLLQHLLGAVAAVLVFFTTLRLFGRVLVALAAGLMAGWYGPAIFYEGQLLPDAILPLLLATSALLLVRHAQRFTAATALFLGLALGLTALARPTALLWVPAIVLWTLIWRRRVGWRDNTLRQILLLVGLVLVVLPVTLRNYLVERDLVLITANEGLNLYIGNNPNAHGTYNLPAGLWFRPGDPLDDFAGRKAATRAVGHALSSAELSRWWRARALAHVRANPGHTASLVLQKLRLWVSDYEFPQLYSYHGYREICPVLWILPTAGFIIAPGLVGLALLPWIRRQTPRLMGTCAVLSALSFIPFFVVGRYRAAWIVVVAPFAALALGRLARRRRLVPIIAALVAATVLCFWPPARRPTRAAQFYAFGNAALGQGDLNQAERWYRRTIAEEPRHGSVNARLGRTLVLRGRPREALALLEHDGLSAFRAPHGSVEPGAQHEAERQLVRGLAQRGLGHLNLAEEALLDAVQLSPGRAEAWLELAEVKAARGKTTEAIEAYRSVLVMAGPGEPWVAAARRRLEQLERAGQTEGTGVPPGRVGSGWELRQGDGGEPGN